MDFDIDNTSRSSNGAVRLCCCCWMQFFRRQPFSRRNQKELQQKLRTKIFVFGNASQKAIISSRVDGTEHADSFAISIFRFKKGTVTF
jgi:hypothetical protein